MIRRFQMYFVLITVFSLGCATTSPSSFTDFLGDTSRLEPHPEVAGASVFWNPDVDHSKYESIMIDPIELHFAREKQLTRSAFAEKTTAGNPES